jgi:hypothetical protein
MAVIEDHALERIQRGHGLGIRLTGPATSRAKGAGLSGICLETRDLHLFACWACLKYGFCPGGIDRTLYAARLHTQKTALLFYLCLQG